MKKLYCLIGVVLFTLNMMSQDLTIKQFPSGSVPVIDGTVDPIWNAIDEVVLSFEPTDDYGDATILEGWFKMGWNSDSLFLLIRRDDDDFANQWETGLEDWKSDRDEIFFDVFTDTLADGRGASDSQEGASYGHYQFTSIWVQNQTDWIGNPTQWYHNAPFKFGYSFDSDNSYFSEYAFPFSSLTIDTLVRPTGDPTFEGGAGVTFGLQIAIGDVDMADSPTDETFRKWIKWVDEGGWDDMDQAGRVLMDAAYISGIDNETISENMVVYPNPAADYIMIKNIVRPVDVIVYDVLGQIVFMQKNISADSRIDISSLTSGLYYISPGENQTIKFVKE